MKLLIFFISALLSHPIHVSMTNIDINNSSKTINITIKVFSDDFQKIINKKHNADFDIKDSLSIDNNKKYIMKYFTENLKIIINKKSIFSGKIVFNKTKSNYQATWFYFTINKKVKVSEITVYNNLLNDLYQDQKNLVFIKYNDIQKSFMFSNTDIIKRINVKD